MSQFTDQNIGSLPTGFKYFVETPSNVFHDIKRSCLNDTSAQTNDESFTGEKTMNSKDMPTNYNDEPIGNADRFYKKEDGTPDFTREIPTGLPAGVNLHEAALTRPHMVEKIIAENGPQAQVEAAQKSNKDNERALTTIVPDTTKTPEVLEGVDAAEVINNSTDEIQPNRDLNPDAHTESAQTGTETLEGEGAAADEAAAKAKSQVPAGETAPLKVEVTEKTDEQKAAEEAEAKARADEAAAKEKADADAKAKADADAKAAATAKKKSDAAKKGAETKAAKKTAAKTPTETK